MAQQPAKRTILLACLWAFCVWIAFQTGKSWGGSHKRRGSSRGVFVLDIKFTFKTAKDRDLFIDLWKPLAKHVMEKEPGTISYELSIADSEPLKVLVFERYATKDDYHIHKNSKPFEEFHMKLRDSGITWVSKEGQSFFESGVGFVCDSMLTAHNISFDSSAPGS